MATRIYFKTFASAGIVVSAFAVHGAAEATTLFADNFESYAPGSNLVGQGGWAALPSSTGGGVLLSNTGSLPTTVLDGLAPTSSGLEFIVHPFGTTISSAVTTVLKFNALGINAAGVSHDSWAGLSGTTSADSLDQSVVWTIDASTGGWSFDIRQRQSTGIVQSFATHAGYNLPAALAIFFDPIANEVWGTFDFGAGAQDTSHFSVLPTTLAAIDRVNLGFDFRGTRGIQLDNISVTTVPLPAAWVLLLGAVPTLTRRKIKVRV